jgi:hypothetical protein
MRRPFDSKRSKLLHSDLNHTIGAVQRGVERHTQTRDDSDIVRAFGTLRQHQKPIFRRHHVSGQEFTLGGIAFNRENELVIPVPALFGQQRSGGT